jgi:hypothetical protein
MITSNGFDVCSFPSCKRVNKLFDGIEVTGVELLFAGDIFESFDGECVPNPKGGKEEEEKKIEKFFQFSSITKLIS